MPSPSNRPYKSQLFNFLNRQSVGLRDRLGRVTRHLKVAAEWGTQMLIYPLYLLVQAGRTVRRQLGQTVEQISLPSGEVSSVRLTSDRPLNKVLEEIEPWLTPSNSLSRNQETETETDDSNLTAKFIIQGIASVVDNHCLVLVNSNNQTVDLLSPSQQKILQKRIQVETANYWYDRRLQLTQSRITPGVIPSFSTNSPNVLPPVRWFWQGMRWMQTSPVATTLNLFGESSLDVTNRSQPVNSLVSRLPSSNFNSPYLEGVIQRATNYLYRSSQSKQLSSKTNPSINRLSASRLKASSSPQKNTKSSQKYLIQSVVKPVKNFGQKLQKQTHQSLREETDNPFQIKMLIFAAIDYFFGDNTANPQLNTQQSIKTLKSGSSSSNSYLPEADLTNEKIDDPWLSWDDLYVEETTSNVSQKSPPSPLALPQASKLPTNPVKSLKKRLKNPLKRQNNSKTKKKPRPVAKSISKVQQKQKSVTKVSAPSSSLKKGKPQADLKDYSREISPDWIETEAKPTGYVKHPLEYILEWLDLIISWLEKLGGQLWKWLRKLVK